MPKLTILVVSAKQAIALQGGFGATGKTKGACGYLGCLSVRQVDVPIEGRMLTVQRFERNRLELHPENKAPYDVLSGRLGADRLKQQARDWFTFPKTDSGKSCRTFAETGHTVCGRFLTTWRRYGLDLDGKATVSENESLALFGLPVSDIITERLSDGKEYQVQWFERSSLRVTSRKQRPL
jgi:hypothetical protein